jgi:hypothetical protein
MQTRDVVGFVLVPLVMLTAVVFAEIRVLSGFGAVSAIVWALRLGAYALLVVGATSLLCQTPPARIPIVIAVFVWAGSTALILLKFLWDAYLSFEQQLEFAPMGVGRNRSAESIWHHTPELIGFSLVLFGAFLIPRAAAWSSKWSPTALPVEEPDRPGS